LKLGASREAAVASNGEINASSKADLAGRIAELITLRPKVKFVRSLLIVKSIVKYSPLPTTISQTASGTSWVLPSPLKSKRLLPVKASCVT